MTSTIIIAEDDRAARYAVARVLGYEGYEVIAVDNGDDLLASVAERRPDLIILDLMMPRVDGLTVCRRLRQQHDKTPILITTARSEISDRVSGLDAGADDYLPKPYSLDELLARVRALLRRSQSDEPQQMRTLGSLRMDLAARRAWRDEDELDLTKTEFDLLELLVRNANIVLTHSQIYNAIWEYDFGSESKALAVYVGYLRRKTEQNDRARLIHTVRGVGYVARDS